MFSAQIKVQGLVISGEDGQPIVGATVKIKGTKTGTMTDANGIFSFSAVELGSIFTISHLGFLIKEEPVKPRLTIILTPSVKELKELLVTALGLKREQNALGYAVSTVNSQKLNNAREANIVNALAGKVAGVYVNNSSGLAGSSARILIRGNSSLRDNSQPMFIIDGVPFDNSEHTVEEPLLYGSASNTAIDIDANQIESISVLKGAAATALYGSRASGGVVMITTKGDNRLRQKTPAIEFSSNIAFDVIRPQKRQNIYAQGAFGEYYDGSDTRKSAYSWGPLVSTLNIPTYNLFDFFQTGRTYNNSFSIHGNTGNNSSGYFAYSNYNQDGTEAQNSFDRNNILAKYTISVNHKLNIATKFGYTHSENKRLPEGNELLSPMWTILGGPVTYNFLPAVDSLGNQRLYQTASRNNHYFLKDNTLSIEKRNHFTPNISMDYKILPWMTLCSRLGMDVYRNRNKFYENTGLVGSYPDGRLLERTILNREINSDLMLQINKSISPDVTVDFLLGNNINAMYYNEKTVQGTSFIIPGFYNLSNTTSQNNTELTGRKRSLSYYSQAVFSYKEMLYLTLTGRNDWSSTLPNAHNSYFYPSVSTGFVFSNLLKQSHRKKFNYGKLRLSYARVGNDASPYATLTSYEKANPSDGQAGNIEYPFNGIVSYLQSRAAGNSLLKPELSTEWESGLELRLLNDRIGIDVTCYNKSGKNQIFNTSVASETGYTSTTVNAGEISNKGIELQLNLTPVVFHDFKWNIGLNYTRNRNRVVKLDDGVDNIPIGGFVNPGICIQTGSPLGVIWGTKFKRNIQNQILVDNNGYPIPDDELGPIGNTTPDWIGAVSNIFTWKGLSLSALVDVRVGGELLNLDEYYMTLYGTSINTIDRNHPIICDGANATTGLKNTKAVNPQDYYQTICYTMEYLIQKSDYIRLREVTLGYRIPLKRLKLKYIKGLDIAFTGRNLWLQTDKSFTGSDPEQNLYGSSYAQGIINFQVPSTKSYNFSIKIAL